MTVLSDLAHYVTESVPYTSVDATSYISTENMIKNRGGIELSSSIPKSGSVRCYKKGDILLSNIRVYFKKIWHAKFDGTCSTDVLVIRPAHGVDSDYLYYALSTDQFFEFINKNPRGTKMPRGDKNMIMEYPIDIPDHIDPNKIGKILRKFDDEIDVLKQINDNLGGDYSAF